MGNAPTRTQATILVVDDDPAMLALLESWLGQTGYEMVTAGTAGEALDLFRSAIPTW